MEKTASAKLTHMREFHGHNGSVKYNRDLQNEDVCEYAYETAHERAEKRVEKLFERFFFPGEY